MPNGRIEIKHNFASETDYVIITWRKTSNLLAEVGRHVYAAPHTEESLIIEGLDPVMFLVTPYRSADGVALDQIIPNQLAVDARTGSIFPITRKEYVVGTGGVNPAADQGSLRDPDLLNKAYYVEERGTGSLSTTEITIRNDDGGGFDFTDVDKKFEDGRRYFIYIIERVDAPDLSGGNGNGYNVVVITANTDFDPDIANSLIVANFAGNKGKFTFGNLLTLPDCRMKFQTHGGNQIYLQIQLDVGDTINFQGEEKNVIYLAKGEELEIIIKENVMYVLSYSGNAKIRGSVHLDHYSARHTEKKCYVLADEDTGVLDGEDYNGLYEIVLGMSGTIDLADWAANKGKFAYDTSLVTKNFRVPSLRGQAVKTTYFPANAPGVLEPQQVGEFKFTGYRLQKSGTTHQVHVIANITDVAMAAPPEFTFNATKENRVNSYSQKPYIVL